MLQIARVRKKSFSQIGGGAGVECDIGRGAGPSFECRHSAATTAGDATFPIHRSLAESLFRLSDGARGAIIAAGGDVIAADEAFSARGAIIAAGGDVIAADEAFSVQRYGRFAFAFWPMLAAEDPSVGHVVVREAGFHISPRERPAVEEWIKSG
ncbi:hypothetical protein T484DRAFT_1796662, partial [Baffinella frigidus]